MATADTFESEENVERRASDWLIERVEGFSPERAALFARWCAQDQRHAHAVARVEQTMEILDQMPAIRGPLEARADTKMAFRSPGESAVKAVPFPRGFGPWRWLGGLAAAFVVGVAAWRIIPARVPAVQVYMAGVDTARRVSLSDSSVVDLNVNSRLDVQFSAEKRQVTLSRGEAHFKVAHDAAHPFVVIANGISIRAIGTAFDVRLEGGKVDVLVTEGRVIVERPRGARDTSETTAIVPMLAAGERIAFAEGAHVLPTVEKVPPAEAEGLLAWQNRMTSFTDVPLHEMVERLNRCNTTQLVLGDEALRERTIGGVIVLNDVDAFVHLLEQDGDVVAQRQMNDKIILRRTH